MRFQILVIDDEWKDDREKGYGQLASSLNDRGFETTLDFLKQPGRASLIAKLYNNQYTAVITDAVLDGKWPDFTIADVMDILDDTTPIAIVSERWNETNAPQIARALKKPNCRTFLHWRDIDLTGDGQIEYSLESVLRMITDYKNIDISSQLEPDDDIRIIHISDVHTGGIEDKTLKNQTQACANAILRYWEGNSPTFVAFTGDVTEYGAPSQYVSAHTWISYFFKRLRLGNLPSRNLLYVPGNHDVNLCLSASSRINLSEDKNTKSIKMVLNDEEIQPELIDYAYVPFRNFLAGICDCPLINKDFSDHALPWVEARFRHLGIIFYGINTAQPANAYGLPGREVNEDALASIGEELTKVIDSCEKPPLVIGIGHHSPTPAEDDGAVTNITGFKTFFQSGGKTALFMHGHSHESDINDVSISDVRLVRSCAPTFRKAETSRPADTLRGFHLLTLHREKNEVKSLEVCSFEWKKQKAMEGEKCFYQLQDGIFHKS